MFERGALATGGLSFAELKTRSLVNVAAKAADAAPAFSRLIRIGLPGFENLKPNQNAAMAPKSTGSSN
jgi:hypothetical protein